MHYEIGDLVEQTFADGHSRFVIVTDRTDNIKNGIPGFGGLLARENGELVTCTPFGFEVWGYDYEVNRVVNPDRDTEE